jgi:hypothetical protein
MLRCAPNDVVKPRPINLPHSGLHCGCGNFLFELVAPAGFLHKLNFHLSFTSGTAHTKLKVANMCYK